MSPKIYSDMIVHDAKTDGVDISQSAYIHVLVPLKKKMSRSVTFAKPLVTEVRYRPRTKKTSRHELYFTTGEYHMFRREYNAYKEELRRRQEEISSSPLFLLVFFASSFISGLDARQREYYSSLAEDIATAADKKSFESFGDLYDIEKQKIKI